MGPGRRQRSGQGTAAGAECGGNWPSLLPGLHLRCLALAVSGRLLGPCQFPGRRSQWTKKLREESAGSCALVSGPPLLGLLRRGGCAQPSLRPASRSPVGFPCASGCCLVAAEHKHFVLCFVCSRKLLSSISAPIGLMCNCTIMKLGLVLEPAIKGLQSSLPGTRELLPLLLLEGKRPEMPVATCKQTVSQGGSQLLDRVISMIHGRKEVK